AKCKDGVRVLNVARGPLIVDDDLRAALDSGKVAGAALDVFRTEPVTDHPLFGYPNVIVTPHLGASTAEATDRAGYQAAVPVVAGDARARVAGTTLGRAHRPHLVEAWGQRFNVQMEDDYIVLFRYRDTPGMMGRAGTCFGANGVNINSAAVGHVPEDGGDG